MSDTPTVHELGPASQLPDEPRPPSGYIPTLDGWRALAIIAVILFHGFPSDGPTRFGYSGVSVFFALSGFLICSRLLQERHRTGTVNLKQFYIRRSFRILPPYLVYLVVIALLAGLGILAVRRAEMLSCLGFYRNYLGRDQADRWTGHFWSLSVEEHFYLFFPCLLLWNRPRRALWVVGGLALAFGAWRTLYYLTGMDVGAATSERTELRIDRLLWGAWLALLLEIPGARDKLRRLLIFPVWLGLIALYLFGGLLLSGSTLGKSALWQPPFVALIVVGTVLRPESLVGRLLELPVLRWIGRLSYGLYIWQQLFFLHTPKERLPQLWIVQTWPINVLACLACAIASFYLLEKPLIRFGHSLSLKFAKGRVAALPAIPSGQATGTPDPVDFVAST